MTEIVIILKLFTHLINNEKIRGLFTIVEK